MMKTFYFPTILAFSISISAGTPDIFSQAQSLRNEGRISEAKRIYDSLLSVNPQDVDSRVGRGYCWLVDPLCPDSAAADFAAVISAAPDYLEAYTGFARAAFLQGKDSSAAAAIANIRWRVHGNKEQSAALAQLLWEAGFFPEARDLESGLPPGLTKRPEGPGNTITLETGMDWPVKSGGWWNIGMIFKRRFRPDAEGWIFTGPFHRYGETDKTFGGGASFRYSRFFSVSYKGIFSGKGGFLPRQQHQPLVAFAPLRKTSIAVGGDLSAYPEGWVRLVKLEWTQYCHPFSATYDLLAGKDNFDRNIMTHILDFQYDREKRFAFSLGGAIGNESVEMPGGPLVRGDMTNDKVASFFTGGTMRFCRRFKLLLSLGEEWRNSEPSRAMVGLTSSEDF